MKNFFLFFIFLNLLFSCNKVVTPKPKAQLRLAYPDASYQEINTKLPFSFEKNKLAKNVQYKNVAGTNNFGLDINYPLLKGTIYLTYKAINKDKTKLISFLQDAQNFTQEHTQKADVITEMPYENKKHKVYGMFYEVGGNAASQSQFYVTDSVQHFISGSLYFYAKPNFDSILPAALYLQKDIKHLMETIKWRK